MKTCLQKAPVPHELNDVATLRGSFVAALCTRLRNLLLRVVFTTQAGTKIVGHRLPTHQHSTPAVTQDSQIALDIAVHPMRISFAVRELGLALGPDVVGRATSERSQPARGTHPDSSYKKTCASSPFRQPG